MRLFASASMILGTTALVGPLVPVSAAPLPPVVATIPVGAEPGALVVDPQGPYAFVANYRDGTVSTLDPLRPRVVRTTRVGAGPAALAVDAHDGQLFVANADSGTVSALTLRTGALRRTIHVDPYPVALVVTGVGAATHLFIGALGPVDAAGGVGAHGSVTMVDAPAGIVVRHISVGAHPTALAVDGRVGHVVVLSGSGATLLAADSGRVLHQTTVAPSLAVAIDARTGRAFAVGADKAVRLLDTRTGALLRTVSVGENPRSVGVDERAGRVFVTVEGPLDAVGQPRHQGHVVVLDATTGALVGAVQVGKGPDALALDGRTGKAFVVNDADNTVSAVDVTRTAVDRTVPVGTTPVTVAVDQRDGRVLVTALRQSTVSVLDERGL